MLEFICILSYSQIVPVTGKGLTVWYVTAPLGSVTVLMVSAGVLVIPAFLTSMATQTLPSKVIASVCIYNNYGMTSC